MEACEVEDRGGIEDHCVDPAESAYEHQPTAYDYCSLGLEDIGPAEGKIRVKTNESLGLIRVKTNESLGFIRVRTNESLGFIRVRANESLGFIRVKTNESLGVIHPG